MIRLADGKLGAREIFGILYIMLAIRVTDITPNLLLEHGINAAWIMPLLSSLYLFVSLLFLFSLLKTYNTGLLDIITDLTGPFIGRLIIVVMFVIVFSSLTINSRTYADITIAMYYPHTSVLLILVVLILVSGCFIARLGLLALSSASWLAAASIFFTSILLLILVRDSIHLSFIFPIAGPGSLELLKDSFQYSSFLGDIILVGAVFSKVRSYSAFRTGALWGFVLSTLKMTSFLATYIMVFDYPAVRNIVFPYHQLARMAMVGSMTLHVEAVFLYLWMFGAALHFSIYLYISAFILQKIINAKKVFPLIFLLAVLSVSLGLIPDNFFQGFKARELLLKFSSFYVLALPVLLWIISRVKRRLKR